MNLYGFVYNRPLSWIDILGREPSFWDQTSFGPASGCSPQDTKWFEKKFPADVKRWKEEITAEIQDKISCEEETEKVDGIEPKEVVPWPQSWWSMVAQLGTVSIKTQQPITINWTNLGVGKKYTWATTIWVSDGLGWDATDGPVFYIFGDGNPMFCSPQGGVAGSPPSFFPDREITRASWLIQGSGVCPCKKEYY
jgi:hypothetical protein